MAAEGQLAAHLFRRESGRMVASLVRVLGPRYLDLAEDCIQESFIRALERWPFEGVPANPAGWLTLVARNCAIDRLRRDKRLSADVPDAAFDAPRDETAEQLELISLCCHPGLSEESRIALTLKTACGFSTGEIARALLAQEPAVAQRIVRAKRRIRDEGLNAGAADSSTVLRVLYLLYNEGYSATGGDELLRMDLCEEAIRLTMMVADHHSTASPAADALAALMLLQAARFAARIDDAGALTVLDEQDRNKWDARLISAGLERLRRSARGDALTVYHLQAEIASLHVAASPTDWVRITSLYDALLEVEPSPVVKLNRAVAVARVAGARAGITELVELEREPSLENYHLLPAVLGALWREAGDANRASQYERRALSLAPTAAERRLLERRVESACDR